MISILHSILTDSSIRDSDTIQAQLSDQNAAGVPWLD